MGLKDTVSSPSALRRQGMVGELEIPIVTAGATAFTAQDDLSRSQCRQG